MSGKMLSDEQLQAIKERLANGIMSLRGSWRLNETRTDIDALLAHIEAMQEREKGLGRSIVNLARALETLLRSYSRVHGQLGDHTTYEGHISTGRYDKARAALAAVKEGSE